MTFLYDDEGDVLYAFFGNPTESEYDQVGEGIYLRRDSQTDNYIGFMILNYSIRFVGKNAPVIPHFEKIGIPPLQEISF